MRNSKQLLIAFLIPFLLALTLGYARGFFTFPDLDSFYSSKSAINRNSEANVTFAVDYAPHISLLEDFEDNVCAGIVIGLFVLADLLPLILYLRSRQVKRDALKLIES